MDVEIIKKHWDLIELVALHDYIPSGHNEQVIELKNQYNGHVDLFCGSCVITMFKEIYYANRRTIKPN